jgi:hypothetical protein
MAEIRRLECDAPVHWPEALVKLIDALHDFIQADTEVANDLLRDGSITREQYEFGMRDVRALEVVAKALELHGPDPSLHGLLLDKRK